MSLIRRLKHAAAALLGITLLWTAPAHATGTTPLALAVQADSSGNAVPGCLLYFFVAGTVATPQNAYADFGLTTPLPNPLSCDQAGRVPMHWLADGLIHIRLTDASGVVIVDTTMQVLGPSSGGGGGGGTVDPTTLVATGDIKARYGTGALSGFVRANGLTIGNATSGATERANADAQALFIYLYNTDANLVVSGGRTGNALNDYNASKTLTLPDWRGRALAALDGMGNLNTGRLTAQYFGADPTVLGAAGGLQSHLLTLSETPAGITVSGNNTISVSGSNTFSATGVNSISVSGSNTINVSATQPTIAVGNTAQTTGGGSFSFNGVVGQGITINSSGVNSITASGNNTINVGGSVTIASSGVNAITATSTNTGGQPHSIVPPMLLATIYIKL